jgi:hypothetical protein
MKPQRRILLAAGAALLALAGLAVLAGPGKRCR